MNKKMIVLSLLAGLVVFTLACTATPTQAWDGGSTSGIELRRGNGNGGGAASSGAQGYGQGGAGGQGSNISQYLPIATGNLSDEEAQGLLYMREEEKMARDLYNAFYATWGLPVFQNIAASEQTHMDAVKILLDRYGLADPAQAQPGIFSDADLQALYDQLLASGNQSLGNAIKAGGAVEEVDILDLQARIELTDQADILKVYGSLERGSENHLRAFVRTLVRQTGETYQPQYLSPEAFQAILDGASQGGGRRSPSNQP